MSGGSEGPVMRNADALFGMGVGGATSSPSTQSMRVAYGADGTPVYKSVNTPTPPGSSPHTNVMFGAAPDHQQQQQQHQQSMMMMMKKKRGRPRKYSGGVGVADVSTPLALMPSAPAPAPVSAQPNSAASAPHSGTAGGEFSPASGGGGGEGSEGQTFKKVRGRPPGSTNKIKQLQQHQIQPLPLGPSGAGFTPHVISVKAGEDVSSKIMSFSQNGPRAVCILSANGAISNVTLRQAATSGGTATYEGRFEILSLCGSFLLTEVGGQRSRTGGLSVSLAGPDGRVLGGCVAGLLTAASPVQVIVGSFIADNSRKESKAPNQTDAAIHFQSPLLPSNPMPMSMQPMLFSGGYAPTAAGVSSSSPNPSQEGGSFSESSGEEGGGSSPPNHSTGGNANNNHHHRINNSSSSNNPQSMLGGMPWR